MRSRLRSGTGGNAAGEQESCKWKTVAGAKGNSRDSDVIQQKLLRERVLN